METVPLSVVSHYPQSKSIFRLGQERFGSEVNKEDLMKMKKIGKIILENLFAVLGLAFFLYFIINFTYTHYHLSNYKEYSSEIIIDFEEDYRGNKIVIFEFEADNRIFRGDAYFDDFVNPVIGEHYPVKYSMKNPNISRMEFRQRLD